MRSYATVSYLKRRFMSRTCLVIVGFLLLLQPSWAQRRGTPAGEFNFLFFEAVNLISSDSTKSRIDIHYRIDQEFFVLTRNSSSSFPWEFKRRGEIAIELLDSLGVSKAREIERAEMGTNDTEPTDVRHWYEGIATFNVPPGFYKVILEIDDLDSERKHVNRDATVRARKFDSDSSYSTPMFVDWTAPGVSPDSLASENFGGNMLFGGKCCLYIEFPPDLFRDSLLSASYTILTSMAGQQKPEVVISENIPKLAVMTGYALESGRENGSATYRIAPSPSEKRLGVIIPLASEKLPLRSLDMNLVVKHGKKETKISKNFRMVWPEMPLSLRDIDYALESLRFITTENQLDSLRHGSMERRRDNLEAFWKTRDKSPETAFNEVMTEYYHRVDYARRNFGTLKEPDGLRSDRGRIYVLYGPPTKTNRNLSPEAGYQEVWSYESLSKKFVFADQNKSGNYILISTQPL
jgi:GWxTD domain-containing protein